jgi:hypothetical protein
MITKILKNIFLTLWGWLVITIIASVWLGVKAAHTIDETSQYWTNWFWVSILFPVGLVFFQLLWPYLLKKTMRWLVIFPAGIISYWIYDKQSITSASTEFIWWAGIAFIIVAGFLIWEQPSTDKIGQKKK